MQKCQSWCEDWDTWNKFIVRSLVIARNYCIRVDHSCYSIARSSNCVLPFTSSAAVFGHSVCHLFAYLGGGEERVSKECTGSELRSIMGAWRYSISYCFLVLPSSGISMSALRCSHLLHPPPRACVSSPRVSRSEMSSHRRKHALEIV